ncbi:hypothetical protein CC2G_011085 [Coprinopsis cinerea AmutBmut pab1-1]|nr:hypothetical protein CC2G_011076 [Coprinopsis cinerea AmutBmut pab1-1]KAG2014250.1 hypothetical protein CC2G_011085 [Coprinopsis cinerea AmutBmut pab1-1]
MPLNTTRINQSSPSSGQPRPTSIDASSDLWARVKELEIDNKCSNRCCTSPQSCPKAHPSMPSEVFDPQATLDGSTGKPALLDPTPYETKIESDIPAGSARPSPAQLTRFSHTPSSSTDSKAPPPSLTNSPDSQTSDNAMPTLPLPPRGPSSIPEDAELLAQISLRPDEDPGCPPGTYELYTQAQALCVIPPSELRHAASVMRILLDQRNRALIAYNNASLLIDHWAPVYQMLWSQTPYLDPLRRSAIESQFGPVENAMNLSDNLNDAHVSV